MTNAIEVTKLSKTYRLGASTAHHTLAETLGNAVRTLRRSLNQPAGEALEQFWALRDVSFEVPQGQAIGVIGANGAGKSTLLKLLARISAPTEGIIKFRGRVGSLLEVGAGFHPELSGRDNIYLSGAILGMQRNTIKKYFDQIVDFAEVGQFIDTPVKRYSSGMYMRLAFAVAAHLETEILLVDEVLAVGDIKFQRKCLDRMGDVTKDGRTIVFVSHNLVATQALCPRTIWLDKGRVVADGVTKDVLKSYVSENSADHLIEQRWPSGVGPGSDAVRLRRAALVPADGGLVAGIDVTRSFYLEFDYESQLSDAALSASLLLCNQEGALVFNAGPTTRPTVRQPGIYRDRCLVPGDLMNDGRYRVTVTVFDESGVRCTATDVLVFDIADSLEGRFDWYGKWEGVVRPKLTWSSEQVEIPV